MQEFGKHLQSSFLGINFIRGDISYIPEDSGRNPVVTADHVEKCHRKTGQCIPKYPACVGYRRGKVLCEFPVFLCKNIRMSQRNAAVAVLPQQRSPPSVEVISTAVVLVCVAPDFKRFYTKQVLVYILIQNQRQVTDVFEDKSCQNLIISLDVMPCTAIKCLYLQISKFIL